MTTRDIALFAHLLAVVCFFSGMAVAAAGLGAARRCRRCGEVVALLRLARIGVLLVAVGLIGVLGFGFWLLHLSGYRVGDAWVSAALGLLVASSALGAFGGQRPKQARHLAEQADVGDPPPPAVSRLLADRRSDMANATAAAAAVAILLLMVWKPS